MGVFFHREQLSVAASQKGIFLQECWFIPRCVNSQALNSSCESDNCFVLFCFGAFQMHFAHYLFILQARIAKARKCVRASAVARKEREDPSI